MAALRKFALGLVFFSNLISYTITFQDKFNLLFSNLALLLNKAKIKLRSIKTFPLKIEFEKQMLTLT